MVHAIDHTGQAVVETEIALVKLECALDERTEILQIAEHYKAKVVDYGAESLMLRVYGESEKLDSFIGLLRPFGIRELVRSGKILMARGPADHLDRRPTARRHSAGCTDNPKPITGACPTRPSARATRYPTPSSRPSAPMRRSGENPSRRGPVRQTRSVDRGVPIR